MSNYDWIQVGVKAEICNLDKNHKLNGEIIEIVDDPCWYTSKKGDDWFGVTICDSLLGKERGIELMYLKPFNPPNWEGIADGSVECKSVVDIIKEIIPIGVEI